VAGTTYMYTQSQPTNPLQWPTDDIDVSQSLSQDTE